MTENRTYLDGLLRAHKLSIDCLPMPCGNKEMLRFMGEMMAIPIMAIEREIRKEKGLPPLPRKIRVGHKRKIKET